MALQKEVQKVNGRFTDPLVAQKVIYSEEKRFLFFWKRKVRKHRWRVYKSFKYHVGHKDSNDIIYIPEEYESDLASVPRWFWRVFPPDGIYTQAAVLHDWLCENPDRSQAEIDLVFREAMLVLGVRKWRAEIMYQAVRAFQFVKAPTTYNSFS